MAIDLTTATAYFADDNHAEHLIWTGFADPDTDAQEAAIAQAKRDIALFTKKDPDENEPSDVTDPTEFPRFDYAVYEQAIWILKNSFQVADGSQGTTKFIAGRSQEDEARERQADWISPVALRWLFRGRIMITRG
jgi:hypothetical protein